LQTGAARASVFLQGDRQMESVTGTVANVVYFNRDNGYTVFSLSADGKEVVCTGTTDGINEGEYVTAEGEYVTHRVYGRQLRVSNLKYEMPVDTLAVERYLGSGAIKGVGRALASRIVKEFGDDTLRVLDEEPERLSEVKGISERMAGNISRQFHEKQDARAAMLFLSGYGIPSRLSLRIYKKYGEATYDIIRKNPYRLAEDMHGIGFRIADQIAGLTGIERSSPFRIRSGIIYTMQNAQQEGHTCLPEDLLIRRSAQILEVDEEMVREQLPQLQTDMRLHISEVGGTRMAYLQSMYHIEMETASMLCSLNIDTEIDERELERQLAAVEKEEEITLDGKQREAVREAGVRGVLVITGGPGTGKTTTIRSIIRYFEYAGLDIMLAAPTGRAAKRMSEAAGMEARTIHRMLEVSGKPEEDGSSAAYFARNEDSPLETDAVIIDEASMVDIYLMHSLLKAMPVGTRLILVGDVDQLPSVGPGNVLRDIIDSGCIRSVRLDRIFRQASESDIIMNAHRINQGQPAKLDNKSRDFFMLRRSSAEDTLGTMVLLIRDKLPGYLHVKPTDIQVLTPTRKGEYGAPHLNEILQHYLNPASPKKREREAHGTLFREGDKVMQIKNNYQLEWSVYGRYHIPVESGQGVFNGDIGVIDEIDTFSEQVRVLFDDEKTVSYEYAQLDELELAYAVTVHKSQGSEYPGVIMPLQGGPRMLLNRNILYTAVTRAQKCVVLIGSEDTVNQMIENESENRRYSELDEWIRQMNAINEI